MKILKDKQTRHDFVTYAMCIVAFAIVFFMQSNHMIPRMIAGQLVPITAYIVMAISLNLVVGIARPSARQPKSAMRWCSCARRRATASWPPKPPRPR